MEVNGREGVPGVLFPFCRWKSPFPPGPRCGCSRAARPGCTRGGRERDTAAGGWPSLGGGTGAPHPGTLRDSHCGASCSTTLPEPPSSRNVASVPRPGSTRLPAGPPHRSCSGGVCSRPGSEDPSRDGNPSTPCLQRREAVPSVRPWDAERVLAAALHPRSCLAGLWRRRRRGCAVRRLPSQEVQGQLGAPRLQALPLLLPHQPCPEVQLHGDEQRGLRGVPAGVRTRVLARAEPGGARGAASEAGRSSGCRRSPGDPGLLLQGHCLRHADQTRPVAPLELQRGEPEGSRERAVKEIPSRPSGSCGHRGG